jgi:putative tricarboxylic transport membrane protein
VPRITPILEQSLRQSLIMSNGDYLIFFQRPIAAGLLAVAPTLSAITLLRQRADWRAKLAEVEAGEAEA